MTHPQQKQVCQLDENSIFIGVTTAYLSPLEKDAVYLMPANSIDTTPPQLSDGMAAKWTGDHWDIQPMDIIAPHLKAAKKRQKMTIYYKDGFYISDIHEDIPESAVAISEELYIALLEGQSEGKQIVTDKDGNPQLAEPRPSAFHEFENGAWTISPENATALLAEQQAQMWEKIKQKRYENSLGGVYVASVGKWFQTGEEEKTKYLGLDKVIDKLGEIDWKCADNSFVKMNRTLLDEIFLHMVATENADHINAEKHRVAMMAAENPLKYDYSSGWAQIYEGSKE